MPNPDAPLGRSTPSVPFLGPVKLGTVSRRVVVYKKALSRAGFYPWRPPLFSPLAGPVFMQQVAKFANDHKIPNMGLLGWHVHEELRRCPRLGFPREWAFSPELVSEWDALVPRPAPLYVNPFRECRDLRPWRTDQGVDFGARVGSLIVAQGDGKVSRATTSSGWPGGGCVQVILTAPGPHRGEETYDAEFIDPLVRVGQAVKAGQPIARFNRDGSSGVGIEHGFIRPGTNEPCSTDTSGVPTEGGIRMTRWLIQLGCPTQQHFGPGPTTCPC